MNVTHYARDTFEMFRGHDPYEGPTGTDILLRRYSDGTTTVAFRSGKDRTDLRWGPEVELAAVTT